MKKLSIDIETYSTEDLLSSGVYRYSQSESFEILLLAYSEDGQPAKVIDLTKETIPTKILQALTDPKVIKTAWNALFERVCLSRHLGIQLPPDQWRCSMVHAAYLGLPMSLDYAAKVLKVKEKDPAGKALIRHFCGPCKPTKTNGGRVRNTSITDPEKWAAFMSYCATDVDVEVAISERLDIYEIIDRERELWVLDQQINDRGIMLDMTLVTNAILLHEESQNLLTRQSQELTGLDNPGSVAQLKQWLSSQGVELVSLTKSSIKETLQDSSLAGHVKDALHMRQEMAKTSVKKYQAMLSCVGGDDRARGLLQFYGASRTGRWAGRLIQVQNLPQNHLEALDTAREVVRSGDLGVLEMLFSSTSEVLSQLVRTAFVAPEGKVLISVTFQPLRPGSLPGWPGKVEAGCFQLSWQDL